MRQPLRFRGKLKQVTISKKAGKHFASFLVETEDYVQDYPNRQESVGVDLGIKTLATLSSCDYGLVIDRDLNAAIMLNNYGRDPYQRDLTKKAGFVSARKSDVRLESSSSHVDNVNNVFPTNDLRSLYRQWRSSGMGVFLR
jgi:putative transposase